MAIASYQELATLAATTAFKDRVAIAVAIFARYILNENPATQDHSRRYDWARSASQNPRGVAASYGETIVIDPIFASQDPLNFATTPDSGTNSVQVAVENAVNKILSF